MPREAAGDGARLRVVLIERDPRAVGASVRNFGHAFVSGVSAGEDLECALRARERWIDLSQRVPAPAGAGRHACDRAGRGRARRHGRRLRQPATRCTHAVTAAAAGELKPIPTAELLGAMHGTLDLRINPRSAVERLALLLEQDDPVRITP